jgi:predicted RNA-binding protein YlqC (UPF0109 family)
MRELLEYIIKGIVGDNYSISESEDSETNHVSFIISSPKEYMGTLIGKGGKTIASIRNLLKVRATLEKKGVSVAIEEKI